MSGTEGIGKMYCPQCATPNSKEARFCRSCGQDLEAVGQALGGAPKQVAAEENIGGESVAFQDWMDKRGKGVKNVTIGSLLMMISLLIGVALAIFTTTDLPWILIWTVFFGWMACWGAIALALGIGNLLEARTRLSALQLKDAQASAESTSSRLSAPTSLRKLERDTDPMLSPAPSVTEHTTKGLDEHLRT